jgi:hypothetical protein
MWVKKSATTSLSMATIKLVIFPLKNIIFSAKNIYFSSIYIKEERILNESNLYSKGWQDD